MRGLHTVGRMLTAGRGLLFGRERGRGVILLYHRVADADIDPWDLCVSPRHFAEHLDILNGLGTCRAVRDLLPALAGGAAAPVFAVTFDDGYADNAAIAQPLLAAHGVPATFFMVSDTLGSDEEFWWDAVDRIFLRPGTLPSLLQLHVGGRNHEWGLGAAADYTVEDAMRNAAWRAEFSLACECRQRVFLEVWHVLVGLGARERAAAVAHLLEWAGLDRTARPECAIASREQVSALAADTRFEIGAHTRSHPRLPDLTLSQQTEEIGAGKAALERLLGQPVVSFSYPFGLVTETTQAAVRQAGFDTACTSQGRAVSRRSDPMALPRVHVKNWSGTRFRRAVLGALERA